MATERAAVEPSQRESDILLVRALGNQDELALRTLIDSYAKYIYGKALQIVREPQLAEEVAQDTLLTLWWHPERFSSAKGSVRSFLMGVARNKSIDVIRHEQTIRAKEALLVQDEAYFWTPGADLGVGEAMVMRAAISRLPLTKRNVMFLTYYKGMTRREVAQRLSLPEATVRTRVRDSLIKLKTFMTEEQMQ